MDLSAGMVRVLKADGTTAGAGFMVGDEGLAVTCSHVVQSAGSQQRGEPRPEYADVVLQATQERRRAKVEAGCWRGFEAEDVAYLRVQGGGLPEAARRLPLAHSTEGRNRPFETFGFPGINPEGGIWGNGQVMGKTRIDGRRVLQLESDEVTAGFSGAPVWDRRLNAVTGMIAVIATGGEYGRLAETCFAIPAEVLAAVCPGPLGLAAAARPGESRGARPIDLLRRLSKLFAGEVATALIGEPRKELRQFCLDQASKLPHSAYLDMGYLEEHAADLEKLSRRLPVLLEVYREQPDEARLGILREEARTLGMHLGRVYRTGPGAGFEMG